MADRFLGILRHQTFEFSLGLFVLKMRRPGACEDHGKLGPGRIARSKNCFVIGGFGAALADRPLGVDEFHPLSKCRKNRNGAQLKIYVSAEGAPRFPVRVG